MLPSEIEITGISDIDNIIYNYAAQMKWSAKLRKVHKNLSMMMVGRARGGYKYLYRYLTDFGGLKCSRSLTVRWIDDELIGTNGEVWDGFATRTIGGLTKSDLMRDLY